MMARNDEHTLNTVLAECLRKRNPAWRSSELVSSEGLDALEGSGRPDILVEAPAGAPVVVETEYEPARTVEDDAGGRLNKRTTATGKRIEYAVAVRMPAELRDVPQAQLADHVEETVCSFAVISAPPAYETTTQSPGWARFPETEWLSGGVDDLAGLIENLTVSERVVARSTDILEEAVGRAARSLRFHLQDKPAVLERIAKSLVQDPGEQTDRMAMAIVANACTFHATLAGSHGIRELAAIRLETGTLTRDRLLEEWRRILKVNYWPIFQIAQEILSDIPSRVAALVLDGLAKAADRLDAEGATSSHDLTGRMFQRLIQDRKFLATYYTRPEAAALLAQLAVEMLDIDWKQPAGMTKVRVADLACGTGTLIGAAYHALIARHRRAGGDDAATHPTMMEKCLVAADIMPAAAHLTASMLSSVHPTVTYKHTQIFTLPYGNHPGVEGPSLGSLSLLETESMLSLFGTGLAAGIEGLGGKGSKSVSEHFQSNTFTLADDSLDLAIMNPPFTRPTNHEITGEQIPSFAGFGNTEEEQEAMSAELKRLRASLRKKRPDTLPASDGNAGLASNFLDLAHVKLRPGGALALVMPAALALGDSWKASRLLLARHYTDRLLISLAGAGNEEKSFSADTGMAEVLVLARKNTNGAREVELSDACTTWVQLERRPRNIAEARETARAVRSGLANANAHHDTTFDVRLGGDSLGRGIRASLADGGCAGVADLAVAGAALKLEKGELPLLQSGTNLAVPITSLGDLGTRGPLDRDVGGRLGGAVTARGPFEVVPIRGVPTFPVLWGHDAKRERQLVVEPDTMGSVRRGRKADATAVWKTASRLHFNRDFRLNSQSLAACLTPKKTIGGTAWPSFQTNDPDWDEALAAWANTTLGLLLFWWIGSTQQSGRARLTVSRLPDLAVLDLRELTAKQLQLLRDAFAAVSGKDFLPAHKAHEDPVRQELDRLVLGKALGFNKSALDELALLREKWCAEPSVHGGKQS